MSHRIARRQFLAAATAAAGGLTALTLPVGPVPRARAQQAPASAASAASATTATAATALAAGQPRRFGLGTVTYNFARSMDLDTLIKTCESAGFKAVELRSTHKHGVEPEISAQRRKEVRDRFAHTPVKLFGLGSACEFHSPDAAVVKRNIELSKRFIDLAHDVGAAGVKVRPNGLPKDVPVDATLKQIGHALQQVGQYAQQHGIEIWVEVHGPGTSLPANARAIMDHCAHPAVGLTWNSNPTDAVDGSIDKSFDLLGKFIRCVHIHDLYDSYPYRQLFTLLRGIGYDRFTMAECAESADPLRVMRYYRGMWELLCAPA